MGEVTPGGSYIFDMDGWWADQAYWEIIYDDGTVLIAWERNHVGIGEPGEEDADLYAFTVPQSVSSATLRIVSTDWGQGISWKLWEADSMTVVASGPESAPLYLGTRSTSPPRGSDPVLDLSTSYSGQLGGVLIYAG